MRQVVACFGSGGDGYEHKGGVVALANRESWPTETPDLTQLTHENKAEILLPNPSLLPSRSLRIQLNKNSVK